MVSETGNSSCDCPLKRRDDEKAWDATASPAAAQDISLDVFLKEPLLAPGAIFILKVHITVSLLDQWFLTIIRAHLLSLVFLGIRQDR